MVGVLQTDAAPSSVMHRPVSFWLYSQTSVQVILQALDPLPNNTAMYA